MLCRLCSGPRAPPADPERTGGGRNGDGQLPVSTGRHRVGAAQQTVDVAAVDDGSPVLARPGPMSTTCRGRDGLLVMLTTSGVPESRSRTRFREAACCRAGADRWTFVEHVEDTDETGSDLAGQRMRGPRARQVAVLWSGQISRPTSRRKRRRTCTSRSTRSRSGARVAQLQNIDLGEAP